MMEKLQLTLQAIQHQSVHILNQYSQHPWLYTAACLTAYLALTLSLRFQRLRSIKAQYRKYSTRDSSPRPYFMRRDVFTEKPNEYGRHHVQVWNGMPYYVRPTVWNRWGPSAWVQRLMGLPLPGDEGDKYYPRGYYTPDVGPKYFEGKGRKTLEEIKGSLRVQRTGESPFIKL